jgi:hypothetical protein
VGGNKRNQSHQRRWPRTNPWPPGRSCCPPSCPDRCRPDGLRRPRCRPRLPTLLQASIVAALRGTTSLGVYRPAFSSFGWLCHTACSGGHGGTNLAGTVYLVVVVGVAVAVSWCAAAGAAAFEENFMGAVVSSVRERWKPPSFELCGGLHLPPMSTIRSRSWLRLPSNRTRWSHCPTFTQRIL